MRKSKQLPADQLPESEGAPDSAEAQKPKSKSVFGRLFGGNKAAAVIDQPQEQPNELVAPPAPEPEPELEFNLTPGYDAYLREKAAEEAAAQAMAQAQPPAPAPAPAPAPVQVATQPTHLQAVDSSPIADPNAPIEWPSAA